MKVAQHPAGPYGLIAEFAEPEDLIEATRDAYDRGYRMMEAYTPFPVHGLPDALGFTHNKIPAVVLIGGVVGGLTGFFMQWYSAVISYPLDIGGRPFNSWPAFIPITFEMTVLFAALAAVFGMLALNGLPRPHHPVFNAPNFALATRNRFFLCIQSRDPKFNIETARQFLEEHHPIAVNEVPY
jgi:Protein of unknown function (DUF3341)